MEEKNYHKSNQSQFQKIKGIKELKEVKNIILNNFYMKYKDDFDFLRDFETSSEELEEIYIKKLKEFLEKIDEDDFLSLLFLLNTNKKKVKYLYRIILLENLQGKEKKFLKFIQKIIKRDLIVTCEEIIDEQNRKKEKLNIYLKPLEEVVIELLNTFKNKDMQEVKINSVYINLVYLKNLIKNAEKEKFCDFNDLNCKIFYLQESVEDSKKEILNSLKNLELPALENNLNEEEIKSIYQNTEIIKNELEKIEANIENLSIKESNFTTSSDLESQFEVIKEKLFNIEEKLNQTEIKKDNDNKLNDKELITQISSAFETLEKKIEETNEKIANMGEAITEILTFISNINVKEIKEFIQMEKEAIDKVNQKLIKGENNEE